MPKIGRCSYSVKIECGDDQNGFTLFNGCFAISALVIRTKFIETTELNVAANTSTLRRGNNHAQVTIVQDFKFEQGSAALRVRELNCVANLVTIAAAFDALDVRTALVVDFDIRFQPGPGNRGLLLVSA